MDTKNASVSLTGTIADLLKVLRGGVEPQTYLRLERTLAEMAPGLGGYKTWSFGEAKGQLTEVFRNARKGTIEAIQNTKSGETVLVIGPSVLGQLCETLVSPVTLADAFSDLKTIEEPLPIDTVSNGEDPFSLEQSVSNQS